MIAGPFYIAQTIEEVPCSTPNFPGNSSGKPSTVNELGWRIAKKSKILRLKLHSQGLKAPFLPSKAFVMYDIGSERSLKPS